MRVAEERVEIHGVTGAYICTHVWFWCPGCDAPHAVVVDGANVWAWNRSEDAPTFEPSVLVTRPPTPDVCHSFVRDGQIQFLGDSTHALAGQTVPLPEWTGFG